MSKKKKKAQEQYIERWKEEQKEALTLLRTETGASFSLDYNNQ